MLTGCLVGKQCTYVANLMEWLTVAPSWVKFPATTCTKRIFTSIILLCTLCAADLDRQVGGTVSTIHWRMTSN